MNTIQYQNITTLTPANCINKNLAVGCYDVQINPRTGDFELHHRPPFIMPPKIYGGHDQFILRVLKTFRNLNKGMAVLLNGLKGCGKTLTAKQMANQSGMPVLTVNVALHGMGFNAFLTDLPNPCFIFIDEFEKIYGDLEVRNSFLGLLDGASDNKHLFVLTSNEPSIGEYFNNRPGRIRYNRNYNDLPDELLMEMITDMVPEGRIRDGIISYLERTGPISPDALSSLANECMIHDEIPDDFIEYFNISNDLTGSYEAEVETIGYLPKPNLNKDKKEDVSSFLEAYHEYGIDYAMEHYEAGAKNCLEIKEIWRCNYCYPFSGTYRSAKHNEMLYVRVNFAEKSGSKRTRTFQWNEPQIESLTRNHGMIIVNLKDGTIARFRKTNISKLKMSHL